MNPDILMPILAISAIAIGISLPLHHDSKHVDFDERQLIERGHAANLAMMVGLFWFAGLCIGYMLELLHAEYMVIYAIYAFVAMTMVHMGYCIFHDAFLTRKDKLQHQMLATGLVGVIFLVLTLINPYGDIQNAWIAGAGALAFLSVSAMLLLRAFILRIQDRRSAKEDDDE